MQTFKQLVLWIITMRGDQSSPGLKPVPFDLEKVEALEIEAVPLLKA